MRVLIIGMGSIGKKHVAALREIDPFYQIYALRSSRSAEEEENVYNIFSWEEAINMGPYEFAIISNPTGEHGITIQKVIPLNCPLFIEKPVLESLKDAAIIEDLIRNNQIITYVACNLRFHPCIKFIKKFIGEKNLKIQETNSYCGSYLPAWRPGKDFRTLYSAKSELGGGVHLDLIHELDYLHWIFGCPIQNSRFFNNCSALNIDAPDYAHYVLNYGVFYAAITLNYFRRIPKRTFEIITDENVIEIDLLKGSILMDNEPLFMAESGIKETYVAQLQYFIEALKTGSQPMNSFSEAIKTLKICLG